MDKPVILGTGLSGLVGSRIVDLLSQKYSFQNLDLTTGVDITDEENVMQTAKSSPASAIIHCAAFTDPTAAWQQRGDKHGLCYKVNVLGTENLARAAQKTHKHFMHLSTAFVFDGEKDGLYVEDDPVHPIEWYGETKALAEQVVQQECDSWTIFRIDQPFRSDVYEKKPDTTHKLIQGLQQKILYPQFTDHWFSPTVVEDFAQVVDWAIENKPNDIYHATCGVKVSDFEYASMINDVLQLDSPIQQGSLTEYLKTAARPYQRNTAMDSKKLSDAANMQWTTLADAIRNIAL